MKTTGLTRYVDPACLPSDMAVDRAAKPPRWTPWSADRPPGNPELAQRGGQVQPRHRWRARPLGARPCRRHRLGECRLRGSLETWSGGVRGVHSCNAPAPLDIIRGRAPAVCVAGWRVRGYLWDGLRNEVKQRVLSEAPRRGCGLSSAGGLSRTTRPASP
jgi:hypothetical protein